VVIRGDDGPGGPKSSGTKGSAMSVFRFQMAVSLDGFVAGPNQSEQDPLGVGGMQLHEWVFELEAWRREQGQEGGVANESTPVVEEAQTNVGAVVMGRNMFGGGPGPWDESWKGWWGDDPPYHHPVFVLTSHPREPLEMQGGTTFHFVTEGIGSALEQARAAAEEKDVSLGGGASVAQQYLAAGLLDEIVVSVVPILLGGGARLFENVGDVKLEQVESVEAPGVTHIRYARA
jgi:dihydrofolate reductase